MAKISILLPVFNGERFLETCLKSVFAQSLHDFELCVGDDGSTDNSRKILERYNDPRLRFLPANSSRGLFANLNRLIRVSSSPLIRILCQDDVLDHGCLAEEVAFFDSHPAVAMTFCKGRVIDQEGETLRTDKFGDLPEVMPPMLTLQHLFYHGCFPGNLSTVCFRRAPVSAVGWFDESYAVSGDYEMWSRIGSLYPTGVIHRHLVRIRSHRGQLSAAARSGLSFVIENRRVREKLLPRLPPQSQESARRFEHIRHDVLDFHFSLRCLLVGRPRAFTGTVLALGALRWLWAGVLWVWTLNNRRFRPQANWVLPDSRELADLARRRIA